MKHVRQITVFDAADIAAESTFWAAVLGGQALQTDSDWHDVVDAGGNWRMSVQLAPGHVAPQWPNGDAQQIHLDLHVEDQRDAHMEVIALGATLLQAAPDTTSERGFSVYADPAGHPFCICWGH